MLSCLGVGPDSLPQAPPPPPHLHRLVHGQELTANDEEREGDFDSMRATLDRGGDCGASFSQMLDKNKIFNQNITGSIVKRFDDIKKAVNPYSHLPLPGTSKFYIEDMRQEDDNFFEDMTNLHSNQHKLFEQSCEQVKVKGTFVIVHKSYFPLLLCRMFSKWTLSIQRQNKLCHHLERCQK